MCEAFKLSNLTGLVFLKSDESATKGPKSVDIADRTEDLTFIHVCCTLQGPLIDNRIKQSPLSIQFCLQLPQSSYDSGSNTITLIDTPTHATIPLPSTTGATVGTNLASAFTAVGSPAAAGAAAGASGYSAPRSTTPQMDKLRGLSRDTTTFAIS